MTKPGEGGGSFVLSEGLAGGGEAGLVESEGRRWPRKARDNSSSTTTMGGRGREPSSEEATPRSIRFIKTRVRGRHDTACSRSWSGVKSTGRPALAMISPVAPRMATDSTSPGRIRSWIAASVLSFEMSIPKRRWERTTTPSVEVMSRPRLINAAAATCSIRRC